MVTKGICLAKLSLCGYGIIMRRTYILFSFLLMACLLLGGCGLLFGDAAGELRDDGGTKMPAAQGERIPYKLSIEVDGERRATADEKRAAATDPDGESEGVSLGGSPEEGDEAGPAAPQADVLHREGTGAAPSAPKGNSGLSDKMRDLSQLEQLRSDPPDSLLALDLFQSLEKQFRIRVDRSLLFKEPTIDALASRIASLLDAGKRAQDGDLPVILPDSAARHEPFPLMDMQQAYWVGRTGALVLGNVSCHVYLELETEDLDLPRWEACWNRLIRHHDMLRCVIMEDGRQRILPEVPPFTVTVQDATGLDAGAAEQMVLECRERMGHEVLSAKEWPLFRVAATRMPGGPIRLHISLDLLVADLHSMNLMMNGLESLYRYPEREPAPLDLSFRDYVLALEAFRKSPRYRKDKEYWLERVAALPPAPLIRPSKSAAVSTPFSESMKPAAASSGRGQSRS